MTNNLKKTFLAMLLLLGAHSIQASFGVGAIGNQTSHESGNGIASSLGVVAKPLVQGAKTVAQHMLAKMFFTWFAMTYADEMRKFDGNAQSADGSKMHPGYASYGNNKKLVLKATEAFHNTFYGITRKIPNPIAKLSSVVSYIYTKITGVDIKEKLPMNWVVPLVKLTVLYCLFGKDLKQGVLDFKRSAGF